MKIPAGGRIDDLAHAHPEKPALTFVPRAGVHRTLTWGALSEESSRAARLLAGRGVGQGSLVVTALPNSPEHFIVSIAVWKLGGCILPLTAALPPWERDQILALASPALVVGDFDVPGVGAPVLSRADMAWSHLSAAPLPVRTPTPSGAVASGGSTGRPKIIVHPGERAFDPEMPPAVLRSVGFRGDRVQVAGGPMYHGGPFGWAHHGLFWGHHLVLLEKFEGAAWVDAVERYRAQFAFLVPAMMRRILDVPALRTRDLSSMELVVHGGAPCPPWVKREWIALVGGSHIREGLGSIEGIGNTMIDGDEWLLHEGSVGRGWDTDVRILDESQRDAPRGTIGEIYMRPHASRGDAFEYMGTGSVKRTADGFLSVGDMGWMDDDDYVYVADRRVDMIITGGANVYPAEVEAALSDHPAVRDIVVIGIPDDSWGQRVHAIVELAAEATASELAAYSRGRLAPYKVPKTFEFIDKLPRNEAGKIRRAALVEERKLRSSSGA